VALRLKASSLARSFPDPCQILARSLPNPSQIHFRFLTDSSQILPGPSQTPPKTDLRYQIPPKSIPNHFQIHPRSLPDPSQTTPRSLPDPPQILTKSIPDRSGGSYLGAPSCSESEGDALPCTLSLVWYEGADVPPPSNQKCSSPASSKLAPLPLIFHDFLIGRLSDTSVQPQRSSKCYR
jgi:hypothetical protein